ncbi:hypothetical protein PoB_002351600 [Plakobranchus ocellatus]|uniref:Uncharacterized protein n=1 Tax=Plakobranchus ocellatus TaxID=259542 RepID=A0AAV3ZCP9_9GAST|nr:hypothetical protein PoB_002351600 [Plakobranchus ocellatus]
MTECVGTSRDRCQNILKFYQQLFNILNLILKIGSMTTVPLSDAKGGVVTNEPISPPSSSEMADLYYRLCERNSFTKLKIGIMIRIQVLINNRINTRGRVNCTKRTERKFRRITK